MAKKKHTYARAARKRRAERRTKAEARRDSKAEEAPKPKTPRRAEDLPAQ